MMALCYSTNIKLRSKYWQKLTGQMLFSISGRKPFSAPHTVSAVRASQHKVVETVFVCYLSTERCWFVFESCQPSFLRVCVFLCRSLDWDRQHWHTQTKLCCTKKSNRITRARALLEWMSVSSPPPPLLQDSHPPLHSLSFTFPLFLPRSASPVSFSHLSFDMEISHQPEPEASWLFLKMYLLKAAQFLIKCSHYVYKRQTLSLGK